MKIINLLCKLKTNQKRKNKILLPLTCILIPQKYSGRSHICSREVTFLNQPEGYCSDCLDLVPSPLLSGGRQGHMIDKTRRIAENNEGAIPERNESK
jgi:hypothetical protein